MCYCHAAASVARKIGVNMTKQRKSKSKKKVVKKEEASKAAETSSRDFSTDLRNYLHDWRERETNDWKFSKVLQTWALANCLDKSKIDSALFKELCPYIQTVQGGAANRLLEKVTAVIENSVSNDAEEEDDGTSRITLKRAIRVQKLLA